MKNFFRSLFIMVLKWLIMTGQEALSPDSPEVQVMVSHYHELGLLVGIFGTDDKPGDAEPMHRHGAAHIYIISGSAEIKLEGEDSRVAGVGDEIIISEQQGHAVTVGPDGWQYLFACDPQEEAAQGITNDLN
jgi:hypothetical protein